MGRAIGVISQHVEVGVRCSTRDLKRVIEPGAFTVMVGGSSVKTESTRFEVEYEKYQWLVLNLQGEVDLLRAFLRARYAY